VPEELASLKPLEDETAWRPERSDGAVGSTAAPSDRSLFGSARPQQEDDRGGDRRDRGGGDRNRGGRDRGGQNRGGRGDFERQPKETLKVGENAYRIVDAKDLGRDKELKRTTNSLLNKVCPENVKLIAPRLKEECKVDNVEELGTVINLIFKKALAEPHYCETYADLVFDLKGVMPEFPNPEGGKNITFKAALLNVCQSEFEAMPKTIAPTPEEAAEQAGMDPEEIRFRENKKKATFLANMKFIGNLFLRTLLTTKIIAGVMQDLMMCEESADKVPEEHVVECVCELLSTIGYTLENQRIGHEAITQVCGKMLELKLAKKKDNKSGLLSKRIQFQIQDLLDMRANDWTKKVFKTAAKTKQEIADQAAQDAKTSKPGEIKVAEFVRAGQRPAYLDKEAEGPVANGTGKTAAPGGDWQEIPKKTTRR